MPILKDVEAYFKDLTEKSLSAFSEIDKDGKIEKKCWDFPLGLMEVNVFKGSVFEKAGVMYADLKVKPPKGGEEVQVRVFEILTYMQNPKIPTAATSLRYSNRGGEKLMGFCDIAPSCIIEEDIKYFENSMINLSQKHGKNYEEMRKKQADLFTSKYGGDVRLGGKGVAFDIGAGDYPFYKECGETFLQYALDITKKRKDETYSEEEKDNQLYRRGKWVEFNLMEDEGFILGIEIGVPPEAMNFQTLPPVAKFLP